MKIPSLKQLFSITCSLVLVSYLFAQSAPGSVHADVGVHPILPGGSNITAEDETPIQMTAEKVVMTVREATAGDNEVIQLNPEAYGFQFSNVWFTAVAEVMAEFSMLNPTSDVVSMTVWFPLASSLENISWEINPDEIVPHIESFNVSVDGNSIECTISELPNPKGADKPSLPWASFPVTFTANGYTSIQVRYLVPLVPSIKGSPLALYYVFQTGASWAGPIGQAELIVNLPYPASSETIADLPAESLSNLPYMMAGASSGLPSGVILEGNQARWEWKDFEPAPQDDFSIWLIDPATWEQVVDARMNVEADRGDGDRWLKLANIYRSLATVGYNAASAFNSSYRPLGIQAYQKAAELLPDHPAPHAGLGLLMLSEYMHETNAAGELMDAIKSEYHTCIGFAAMPPYANSSQDYCWELGDILSIYSFNATATSAAIASSTLSAQQTLDEAIVSARTSTPGKELFPTTTPLPKMTSTPQAEATPLPTTPTDSANTYLIPVIAGAVGIIILGYLVSKRLRSGTG